MKPVKATRKPKQKPYLHSGTSSSMTAEEMLSDHKERQRIAKLAKAGRS